MASEEGVYPATPAKRTETYRGAFQGTTDPEGGGSVLRYRAARIEYSGCNLRKVGGNRGITARTETIFSAVLPRSYCGRRVSRKEKSNAETFWTRRKAPGKTLILSLWMCQGGETEENSGREMMYGWSGLTEKPCIRTGYLLKKRCISSMRMDGRLCW